MAARFHGQRKLIDTETGEILHTQVVTKSSGDSGFHKIWLAEILDLMEEVGNAKIKVLMWLLPRQTARIRFWPPTRKLRKVQAWALPPSRA